MNTPKLPTLPFAVFDEFGQPCEDRVRDHFAAAFEELRAQIGHGVSDGWQLVPKEPTPEMCAIDFDCDDSIGIDSARICYKTMLTAAPPAPQALTTCNCRWDGDTQVQQCTLHQAHIDAIHEWAERAKTAEAELATQQQKPLTDEQMHKAFLSIAEEAAHTSFEEFMEDGDAEYVRKFGRAIEAAHNIGVKK